jgi:lipopolysaccharide transport system permease protein
LSANLQENEPSLEPVFVTRIQPTRGWAMVDLHELWQHRDLLFYLVWRDIRVIFSNTGLGVFWIILQPLSTVVVITIVLGIFARFPSGSTPYPVVVLSGMVLYNYFSIGVNQSANSMIANAYLLTKVYFPRLIIPCVPILVGMVDFLVLFVVLLILSIFFGIWPTLAWLFLPVPIIITIGITLGAGLWLSALNIQFRDVGKFIPIFVQIGFYASPIFYLSNLIPENFRIFYNLNPMVGMIDSFRWALIGKDVFPTVPFITSIVTALLLILSGVFVFRRMEENAADVV